MGSSGVLHEFSYKNDNTICVVEVPINSIPTEFQIIENKNKRKVIHPDKPNCSQIQAHSVMGPDHDGEGKNWAIGKSAADKAREGDTFLVQLQLEPKLAVSWKKVD